MLIKGEELPRKTICLVTQADISPDASAGMGKTPADTGEVPGNRAIGIPESGKGEKMVNFLLTSRFPTFSP